MSGWGRLLVGVVLLYLVWGHACPWVLSLPLWQTHRDAVRQRPIAVGAMFYTELDRYPGKPAP
jgi:hypothetical protein